MPDSCDTADLSMAGNAYLATLNLSQWQLMHTLLLHADLQCLQMSTMPNISINRQVL